MSPIVSAVLFAIVASPEMYKLTRSIGGDWIATSDGAAKMGGLILHAIVFVLLSKLVWGMMRKSKSSKSGYFSVGEPKGWGVKD
jgi:hypothetical protein